MGANAAGPGAIGIRVHMGNTMNLPIEAIEAAVPVRFHAYGLVRGSGGAGRRHGGYGVGKVFEVLSDKMEASILGERTVTPAAGAAGGEAGGLARFLLHPGADGDPVLLGAKSGPHLLRRGDRLEMVTAGGGGWG